MFLASSGGSLSLCARMSQNLELADWPHTFLCSLLKPILGQSIFVISFSPDILMPVEGRSEKKIFLTSVMLLECAKMITVFILAAEKH